MAKRSYIKRAHFFVRGPVLAFATTGGVMLMAVVWQQTVRAGSGGPGGGGAAAVVRYATLMGVGLLLVGFGVVKRIKMTREIREATKVSRPLPCLECGHTLMLTEPRCPECGDAVDAEDIRREWTDLRVKCGWGLPGTAMGDEPQVVDLRQDLPRAHGRRYFKWVSRIGPLSRGGVTALAFVVPVGCVALFAIDNGRTGVLTNAIVLVVLGAPLVCLWLVAMVLAERGMRRAVRSSEDANALPCLNCGYALTGQPARCPECGVTVDGEEVYVAWLDFRRKAKALPPRR